MGQVVGKLSHPPPSQPFTFPSAYSGQTMCMYRFGSTCLRPLSLPLPIATVFRYFMGFYSLSARQRKKSQLHPPRLICLFALLKKNKMLLHLALLSLQFNMCFSRKEFLRFAVKRRRENAVENRGKACLSGRFNQDQFHSGFPCFVPTHVSLLIQFIINYVYVIHS